MHELAWFNNERYYLKDVPFQTKMNIAGSVLLHTILFFLSYAISGFFSSSYSKLNHQKKVHWCTRVVSNIHAIISFCLASYALYTYECNSNLDMTCFDYEIGYYALQYTIGYFTYDLVLVLLYFKEVGSIGMVMHHLFGIIGKFRNCLDLFYW